MAVQKLAELGNKGQTLVLTLFFSFNENHVYLFERLITYSKL